VVLVLLLVIFNGTPGHGAIKRPITVQSMNIHSRFFTLPPLTEALSLRSSGRPAVR